MAFDKTPQQAVVLEKVAGGTPAVPKGYVFQYTYKSLDRPEALSRASKALARELPDENRLNWKVVA